MDKSMDNSHKIVHFMVEYAFKDVSPRFMAVRELLSINKLGLVEQNPAMVHSRESDLFYSLYCADSKGNIRKMDHRKCLLG